MLGLILLDANISRKARTAEHIDTFTCRNEKKNTAAWVREEVSNC